MVYKFANVLCDPTSDRRCVGSGLTSVKLATGHADVSDQASHAKWATGRAQLQLRREVTLGTWNVTGLLQTGKLHILENELERENIQICGVSETHWKGTGHFQTERNTVYMSSGTTGRNGVAIIVNNNVAKCVKEYLPISDRLIKITITAKPVNLHIIQVYMPTSLSDDEAVEEVYNKIEETCAKIPSKEVIMVIGDFNAKIGCTNDTDQIRNIIGKFGLGVRNERGDRLLQFAINNSLTITNTTFKHHPRRLSTWVSPDGHYKNQIDYILISSRWRSSILNVKSRPGAVCGSNHKLLKAHMRMKLAIPKTTTTNKRITVSDSTLFQTIINHNIPEVTEDTDKTWTDIKKWIINAATQCSAKIQKHHQKHWMTDDTLKLIETRRNMILTNNTLDRQERIRSINKEIKVACKKDKNAYLNNICRELEQHATNNRPQELYEKVKYLSKEFKPKTQIIRDKEGRTVTDMPGIIDVWKDYCKELFVPQLVGDCIIDNEAAEEQEPCILRSEVRKAIQRLKNRKAAGTDEITAEIIKMMGETAVALLHQLCNMVWKTGRWPKDWCEVAFIPLHKKGSPLDCSNYRTIALVSHAAKVLLWILNERLKTFLLPQISTEQTGFIPGRGTREQILNIRQIIEKVREFKITTYICFIDYSKAFDCIQWNKLWSILISMGTPIHLVNLIRSLYENTNGRIKLNNSFSDPFNVEAGVRQGCILSPLLFNIYSEHIMRTVLDGWSGGVTIGGKKLNNLRYADDTVILATSVQDLESIMERLDTTSKDYGLTINRAKTKVMIVSRNEDLSHIHEIAGFTVVDQFNYLGSLIANNGGCEAELRRRLAMARNSTIKLTKVWKDPAVTRNTKLRLLSSLIFPIATYASETWTIKQADKRRIDAFEMWAYRRILRISYTEHRTNVSILKELNISDRLSNRINRQYLKYFGHIMRKVDAMEKLVVTGKVEGIRSRGRSPTRWSDQVRSLLGMGMHESSQVAQDRDAWRITIEAATA